MRLLIAGGGTGGHIYPALAVVDALRRRPNPPEVAWLGGHRGLESRIVASAGIPVRRLALRSLRSVERDVHLVLDPLRLGLSVAQAVAILATARPAAIFTTGGYVAIPVLLAARLLRIPSLLWEGNVVPGRSVRATAGLATAVAVSFGVTCDALGRGIGRRSGPCLVTGTPTRDLASIDRLAARERLGLAGSDRLVLVFGGSQAVRRLNDAVAMALASAVERVHLIHVTGDAGYAAALANREALAPELRHRYRPSAFLGENLLTALAAADLLIGRAGSSTLAEAAVLGLPVVVVPYPHAGGHQRANAEILAVAGAARLIDDAAFDAAALLEAISIVEEPMVHLGMSAAARALGRPGAATAIADIVLALASGEVLPDQVEIDRIARAAEA